MDKKPQQKKLKISIPVGIDLEIEHRDDEDVAGQENTITYNQDKNTMQMDVNVCCG